MKLTCCVLFGAIVVYSPTAAQGLTFDVPVYPVPDDNAFDYYLRATELFPEGRPWDEAYDGLDTLDPLDIELSIVDAGPVLEEFRLGLDKECVMPGPGDFSTLFPYLSDLRSLTRLLMVEAWLHRENDEIAAAFASYMDALKLGRDVARNGPLIHKLVSIACEAITLRQIRRAASMAGDDAALADLVSRLGKVEAREIPLSETLAVEWDWTRRSIEKWKADPKTRSEIGEVLGKPNVRLTEPMLDEALTQLEQFYARMITVAKLDYWRCNREGQAPPKGNPLVEMIVPAIGKVREKEVRHLADLRGTLLLAALELYFVKHERYPQQLAELSPDILDIVPVDPFTGDPFVYRREGDLVYVLYSVGPDMTDDGGLSARPGDTQGDIPFSAIE